MLHSWYQKCVHGKIVTRSRFFEKLLYDINRKSIVYLIENSFMEPSSIKQFLKLIFSTNRTSIGLAKLHFVALKNQKQKMSKNCLLKTP